MVSKKQVLAVGLLLVTGAASAIVGLQENVDNYMKTYLEEVAAHLSPEQSRQAYLAYTAHNKTIPFETEKLMVAAGIVYSALEAAVHDHAFVHTLATTASPVVTHVAAKVLGVPSPVEATLAVNPAAEYEMEHPAPHGLLGGTSSATPVTLANPDASYEFSHTGSGLLGGAAPTR